MFKESIFNLYIGKDVHTNKHILYNTRTGMMIGVPDEAYQTLKNIHVFENPTSNRYITSFINRGFCVPDEINEHQHFFNHYLHFSNSEPEELSFTIAITTGCNYKCFYCFEEGSKVYRMTSESIQDICSFIEKKAASCTTCRTITLKWFGGEPLLDVHALQAIGSEIKSYCSKNQITFRTRIITNGSLLTDKTIDILCELNLISIQISLDGTCEEYCRCKKTTEKSYENVIRIIRTYCDRIHFNLRLNTYPGNFESIMQLTDFLYSDEKIRKYISLYLAPIEGDSFETFSPDAFADVNLTFLQHLYDIGWYSQLKHVMPSLRTSACYNLQSGNYTIDPLGNIFSCESHLGNPSSAIGHVKDDENIVTEKKQTLRCQYHHSINSQCLNCTYFPLCFSGCPRQPRYPSGCRAFQKQTLDTLTLISQIPE